MSKPTMRIYVDSPLDETPRAITEWAEARGGWGAAMPAWQRIQQAAIRSCFEISPSDPLAAAEAYPAIVSALERAIKSDPYGGDGDLWKPQAQAALAKLRKG